MAGEVHRRRFGGIEYILDFRTEDLSSFEAEDRCLTFNQVDFDSNTAFLASIKSAEENGNIKRFLDEIRENEDFEPRFVWHGVRTNKRNLPIDATDFFYIDGDLDIRFFDTSRRLPWGGEEPEGNDGNVQPCATYSRQQGAGRDVWNDSSCDATRGFPLCQINLMTDTPTDNPTKNPTEVPSANPTIFETDSPTKSPEIVTSAPGLDLDEGANIVKEINSDFLAVGLSMMFIFLILGVSLTFQRLKLRHLRGQFSKIVLDI